jgi:biotin transporter BioY
MKPTMRSSVEPMRRDVTTVVLFGAVMSPIVAPLFGWPPVTPLGVPLVVHVLLLAALAAVATRQMWPRRRRATVRQLGNLTAATVLAFTGAIVLHLRSNAFYTASTLMDGMAFLLLIHLATRGLRRRARARSSAAAWVADVLMRTVGWAILASWLLISLEHRHIAGVTLIISGVLQTLALIVLIPDAVVRARPRSERRTLDGRTIQ